MSLFRLVNAKAKKGPDNIIRTSIVLNPKTLEALKAMKLATGVSVSQQINILADEFVRKVKAKGYMSVRVADIEQA